MKHEKKTAKQTQQTPHGSTYAASALTVLRNNEETYNVDPN